MLKSYFFIPANKPQFISKINVLRADNFIFDMEESVSEFELNSCIDNLRDIEVRSNYWVRIPMDYAHCDKSRTLLAELIKLGFRNIVLPKIETLGQLREFLEIIPRRDIKVGILVESPIALIYFLDIVKAYPALALVAIGSHDFCNTIGCKHTEDNIVYLRQKLLTECKAFNIPIVDYVSTNFADLETFQEECKRANNMGFDGKAIIHPKQLEAFNNTIFYSEAEVKEAEAVLTVVKNIDIQHFATLNWNGHLYEKPHLKRLFDIVEWNQKFRFYDL